MGLKNICFYIVFHMNMVDSKILRKPLCRFMILLWVRSYISQFACVLGATMSDIEQEGSGSESNVESREFKQSRKLKAYSIKKKLEAVD